MEQKVGLIDRVAMFLKVKQAPKAKLNQKASKSASAQKASKKTGTKTVKISRRH